MDNFVFIVTNFISFVWSRVCVCCGDFIQYNAVVDDPRFYSSIKEFLEFYVVDVISFTLIFVH